MTPDLRLLSGFARGVSLSLHVRVTCLHSGSWLLSGSFSLIPAKQQVFRPKPQGLRVWEPKGYIGLYGDGEQENGSHYI